MKKISMILIALVLCVAMAALTPAQVMAAANGDKALYISEVKVGMGETSDAAAAELLAEGFTILKQDDGSYADLNEETGTKSLGMKEGPTQKVVYLGYKTTDNPKEAITDLAVMNMNGGYSVQDYNVLMANHLEGEIKPFINRFIAALEEYRDNYAKPEDSINHIRAEYYRRMLNMLTDDDTGNQPLGDLLLNRTKYELSDERYNALSSAEKKKHADIQTILMQGNSRAILLLEMLVVRAADSSGNSWFDRFLDTDLSELKKNIKEDDPSLTTEADVEAELDKLYHDTATALLAKWDSFSEMIARYDDNTNEVANADMTVSKDLVEKVEAANTDNPSTKDVETVGDVLKKQNDLVTNFSKAQEIAIVDFLEKTEYEDGTLRDFFERDKSDFSGSDIRALYPMAAALSEGQVAGLDFLSITDLFSLAITDAEGYKKVDTGDMEPASVFQDVNRDIYEPGGVALTNAALRADASALEDDGDFMLSPLGFVYWGLTALSLAATITSFSLKGYYHAQSVAANTANTAYEANTLIPAQRKLNEMKEGLWQSATSGDIVKQGQIVKDIEGEVADNLAEVNNLASKSKIAMALGVAFTVVTAALAAWSIYTTITEMMDYYKVTFLPIPKYIVDIVNITETKNGQTTVINNSSAYYQIVPCNRTEGSSDVEKENYKILGSANDLNGDVGKQWLSLYSVKYDKGKPILADSFKVVKGNSDLPNGYETGIHKFGETAGFNLTSKFYCYNDTPAGTYVYFKNADKTVNQMLGIETSASGSLFSGGSLAIGAGVGLLLGGGLVVLIMTATRKRKEENAA